jgi:sigma-B regulation protein RsbU (phosphoserine phosphatase)
MLRMQSRVREIALEFVRADGQRVPALVNSVLERDKGGEPTVIRTAVFDATQRREYERELLRARQRAEESEANARLLARTLQQTLIPPAAPQIPDLDVAAVYRPAGSGDEVGGDFYDIFEVAEGDWVIAVGDVCGKGVNAAVVTAVARYTIRAAAVRQPDPCQILVTLNQVLLQHETDRFCTVVLLRLRRNGGSWTAAISSAGHPPALLARAGGDPVAVGRSGALLGVVRSPACYDTEIALETGDALVVYTDGVTEGRRDGDFFGDARLNAAIAGRTSSARSLTEGILADVLEFQSGDPRDDIVVVAVRVP